MSALRTVCAAAGLPGLALGVALAGPAFAQPPAQPPMNAFYQAFYRCDGGEAFMMSYDSEQPATAQMVTNADNRHYDLKRAEAADGIRFTGGPAKFWTDGKSVTVEGTKAAYHNCKMKAG